MARPLSGKEPLSRTREILFDETTSAALDEMKAATGRPVSELVRQAVKAQWGLGSHLAPVPAGGEWQRYIPILGAAPCGPLREAVEDAEREAELFDLGSSGGLLRLREGDFAIWADGDSMDGPLPERIPNGSLIFFRPDQMPEGKVCLCRVTTDEGLCLWTVKKWRKSWQFDSTGRVMVERISLRNGHGKEVALPSGAVSLEAVAVKVGYLSIESS
jgi:hypothetical protein